MPELRGYPDDPRPLDSNLPGRHPGPGQSDRTARAPARRRPPPTPAPRRWGALPGRLGVFLVTGSAALGMLVTVGTRTEPGTLLGVCLVAGKAAAALGVRPRAVYQIIPVPALAYVGAATIAGLIHDRAADTSLTALAVSATQWIASGFLAMTAATVLAIAATVARRPGRARGPHGPHGPQYPPSAARAGRSRRALADQSRPAPGRLERDADYPVSASPAAHSVWPDD